MVTTKRQLEFAKIERKIARLRELLRAEGVETKEHLMIVRLSRVEHVLDYYESLCTEAPERTQLHNATLYLLTLSDRDVDWSVDPKSGALQCKTPELLTEPERIFAKWYPRSVAEALINADRFRPGAAMNPDGAL